MPKPPSDLPDTQVMPDFPRDKRQYRSFSVKDKKRILAEAEACRERGELGALLRPGKHLQLPIANLGGDS